MNAATAGSPRKARSILIAAVAVVSLAVASVAVTQQANAGVWDNCMDAFKKISQWFIVVDTAAYHNAPDGLFNRDDLRAVQMNAIDDHIAESREIRQNPGEYQLLDGAAGRLLNNRNNFDLLDGYYPINRGRLDGLIGTNDLRGQIQVGAC